VCTAADECLDGIISTVTTSLATLRPLRSASSNLPDRDYPGGVHGVGLQPRPAEHQGQSAMMMSVSLSPLRSMPQPTAVAMSPSRTLPQPARRTIAPNLSFLHNGLPTMSVVASRSRRIAPGPSAIHLIAARSTRRSTAQKVAFPSFQGLGIR
jgi:hypothetical protein